MNTNAKLLALVLTVCNLTTTFASGGSGSGSGSGGSGGGTSGGTTAVVCFSNLDTNGATAGIAGWALTGLIDLTGFFDYQGEQFTAAAGGHVARLRVPVYRTTTGGNSTVNFYLYTDSPANPGTPDQLLQTIAVTPWASFNNTPVTVNVSNGAAVVAGHSYWLIAEPRSQLRAAWALNDTGETGPHIYIDPYQVADSVDVQGAFEIDVLP